MGLPGAQCIADPTNGKISLKGMTVPPATNMDFTLDSITNPGTYDSPGDVYFLTKVDGGGLVDAGKFTMADKLYGPSFIESFDV